jgi:hypothetical protein
MSDSKEVVKTGMEALAKKAADEFLKKLGIAGAGIALGATEALMGWLEKDLQKKLDHVRKYEGCPHVQACAEISGWAGHEINAMTAAHLGWTAFQSANGLWVFHHQTDYPPRAAKIIFRPVQKDSDGLWSWNFEHVKHRTGKHCKKCQEAWMNR